MRNICHASPASTLFDSTPSLRLVKASLLHRNSGPVLVEMCVRHMQDKKPVGYHTFPRLLLDMSVYTGLLEACWLPMLQEIGCIEVTTEARFSTSSVASLTMSLIKSMKTSDACALFPRYNQTQVKCTDHQLAILH